MGHVAAGVESEERPSEEADHIANALRTDAPP